MYLCRQAFAPGTIQSYTASVVHGIGQTTLSYDQARPPHGSDITPGDAVEDEADNAATQGHQVTLLPDAGADGGVDHD